MPTVRIEGVRRRAKRARAKAKEWALGLGAAIGLSFVSVVTGLLSLPAPASAVVLSPAADTDINNHPNLGGPNHNRGAEPSLWLIPASGSPAVVLLRFDLSGFAGQDVAGDGTLTLPVVSFHPNRPDADRTVSIHLALIAWDENLVTWNNFGASAGPNSGVDFASASLAQVALAAAPPVGSNLTFALPEATLQAWIDSPASNFGLLVNAGPNETLLDLVFRAREAEDGAPAQLSFELERAVETPEPGTLALLALGLVGAGIRRHLRR